MTSSLEPVTMYPRLAGWLERIMEWCLYGAVFFIPVFFLPITLDALELQKQTVLLFLVFVATLAWIGRVLCLRRLSASRTWLHLAVLAFFLVYLVASCLSQDRYVSFIGGMGQIPWACISIAAFVLFYFLLANVVRGTTLLYHLILTFLMSSFVVGVFGTLQLFGIFPLGFLSSVTRSVSFNSIGTVHAFGIYMVVPLVIAASLKVLGCKDTVCVLGRSSKKSLVAHIVVWFTLIVSLAVAVLIDYWVMWLAILFGMALLVIIAIVRRQRIDHPVKVLVPAVLVVVSVVLLLFPAPFHLNLPTEVSPSASASWDIARQTLQDRPLFGSGPGTWAFDYSKYRSSAVNLSQFWTVRFDRGMSFFLTLVATLGLAGSLPWLILVVSAIAKSAVHLIRERNDDEWQAYLTVFTGWATLVFLAFFYNFGFAQQFVFWFLLGLLATLVSRGSLVWDIRSVISSSLASLGSLFLFVGIVSASWLFAQRFVADSIYARAVTAYQAHQSVQKAIDDLSRVVRLNPLQDIYYRNLSQAYLARASEELQNTADQGRTDTVSASVSAALETAAEAVTLSPANVDNWSNSAAVFRAIAPFKRGADERAMDMLFEAQKREPTNPTFSNQMGELHILRADAYHQLFQSKDEAVRKDAEQNSKTELDKAADAFNRAIQVKPDFATAHYNLGLVYERQGRLKDAIAKLEQVLRSDSRNVGVAFQLAILYYRNNEKDKSADLLEQIINFDPAYVNARWYLASLYEQRGNIDEAIAQIESILTLQPDDQAVIDRLEALKNAQTAKAHIDSAPLPEPIKEEVRGSLPSSSAKKR